MGRHPNSHFKMSLFLRNTILCGQTPRPTRVTFFIRFADRFGNTLGLLALSRAHYVITDDRRKLFVCSILFESKQVLCGRIFNLGRAVDRAVKTIAPQMLKTPSNTSSERGIYWTGSCALTLLIMIPFQQLWGMRT